MWLVPRAEDTVVPVPSVVLRWINSHLEVCKRCSVELKNLRLTTFALRKAGKRMHKKKFDPYFADRVLQRVRKEESARQTRSATMKLVFGSTSAFAVVVAGLIWLGAFNILAAQIFGPQHRTTVQQKTVVAPAPFAGGDPFAPTVQNTKGLGELRGSDVEQYRTADQPKVLSPTRPAIPDYLSHVMQPGTEIAKNRPPSPPSFSPQPPPMLATSTFQMQNKQTPPVILASTGASNTPGMVMPAPSAPGDLQSAASTVSADAQPSSQLHVSTVTSTTYVGALQFTPHQNGTVSSDSANQGQTPVSK